MRYDPLFAHLFGMAPWDVDRLTLAQWDQFRKFADDQQQAMKAVR